jgi:hypothetical protein
MAMRVMSLSIEPRLNFVSGATGIRLSRSAMPKAARKTGTPLRATSTAPEKESASARAPMNRSRWDASVSAAG